MRSMQEGSRMEVRGGGRSFVVDGSVCRGGEGTKLNV